jgi:hypothetical protein
VYLKAGDIREEEELKYLYDVANRLPAFLEERGFTAELSSLPDQKKSPLLKEDVSPYYRDYIANLRNNEYRSLHITFYDSIARCYLDSAAPHQRDGRLRGRSSPANHFGYEKLSGECKNQSGRDPERGGTAISMTRMNGGYSCNSWICRNWMSICFLQWTIPLSTTAAVFTAEGRFFRMSIFRDFRMISSIDMVD